MPSTDVLHSTLVAQNAHKAYAWSYADQATREAATGFTPDDVGKLVLQEDDFSLWMLIDDDPVTYQALGGASDAAAIHDDVAGEIHAVDNKASPVDADELLIEDSEDSWNKKRVALSDLPGSDGGGVATYNDAYASPPASPSEGDIWVPNDSFYLLRHTGAAWVPYGPLFPMTPPPALTNWAWVNQDTATADETYGGLTLLNSGSSGQVRALVRDVPSTPYTITAAFLPRVISGDYKVGLCWYDGTKIVTYQVTGESPGQLSVQKWNTVSSWSGNYTNPSIYSCAGLFWLRIADDATNRTCQRSGDGIHWETIHSVSRTDFLTATKVGICSYRTNTSWIPALTLLSWVEA